MNTFWHNLIEAYIVKNLYITAFFAVILLARLLISRLPKRFSYYLWGALGIKAVTDVGFSIPVILKAKPVAETVTTLAGANGAAGITGNTVTIDTAAAEVASVADKVSFDPFAVFGAVWITIALFIMAVGVIRYLYTRRKVRISYPAPGGVRYCDYIDSPMAFGIIKPVIYMPRTDEPGALKHILAHEKCHIRRGDVYFKIFAFVLLAVYWVNPFMWIAYRLFTLDMELSCDEAAVESLGEGSKKDYARTLLSYSVNNRALWLAQTDFADTGTKKRVKNIMNTRKTKIIYIVAGSVLTLTIVALCFIKPKFAFANDAVNAAGSEVTSLTKETAVSTTSEVADAIEPEELYFGEDRESQSNTGSVQEGSFPVETVPANTAAETEYTWLWPLDSTFITSGFGETAKGTFHSGVDVAAPTGTDVYATLPGVVTYADYDNERGNAVIIKVTEELSYCYTHLDSFSVKVGDSVEQGAVIAKVGTTGHSTGPHLHFEIIVNGSQVDPFDGYFNRPENND